MIVVKQLSKNINKLIPGSIFLKGTAITVQYAEVPLFKEQGIKRIGVLLCAFICARNVCSMLRILRVSGLMVNFTV